MALEIPKLSYTGRVKEVKLGTGDKAITVGGRNCYPFHLFEGDMPHPPRIAMEVYDASPEDWPPACLEPFQDVVEDPVAWAKKCIEEFGAKLICLQLVSIDPNGLNQEVEKAAQVVKKVSGAIDIPLIVWGCGNVEKDAQVLRRVAELCEGERLALGPVVEGNYKSIGASAIAYNHVVIASTPIDINLAKQLNILLGDLGVPRDNLLMDPTTGGLGYGIEYTYSVMERDCMAGLVQQDEKLQFPMVCNLAREVWKTKEAKIEDPKLGDVGKRGILMEAITADILLLAGADVLIMRHPRAISLVKDMIKELTTKEEI